MRQTVLFLLTFLILNIIYSCTEATPIGAELLEEDQEELLFSNTVPVNATTIVGTPVPTYSPFVTFQLPNYLFGEIDDPDFGKSNASVYSQISKSFAPPFLAGLFNVDSLVLSIDYDSLNVVGNFSEPFNIEVYRLQESLSNTADYTSDQTFATEDNLIGEATIVPSFIDSIEVDNYFSGTDSIFTTTESAHIRIPLDLGINQGLGSELLDSSIYVSDTTFVNFFRGVYIRAVTSNGGLASFNFNSTISRMTLYYRERNVLYEYRYPFTVGNARNSLLVHETEGAAINDAIDNENSELLYLQSLGGANIEINFPDVSEFDNIVVNRAELELTVATTPDEDELPIVPQIVVSSLRDGEIEVVDDVLAAIFSTAPIDTDVFGGIPVTETVDGLILTTYTINLSGYFQSLVEGNADPNILLTAGAIQNPFYMSIPPKGSRGNIVTILGSDHPEFPPRLNLIYTDLSN